MYHVIVDMPEYCTGYYFKSLVEAEQTAMDIVDGWIDSKYDGDPNEWNRFVFTASVWIEDEQGYLVWDCEEYEPWMIEIAGVNNADE